MRFNLLQIRPRFLCDVLGLQAYIGLLTTSIIAIYAEPNALLFLILRTQQQF